MAFQAYVRALELETSFKYLGWIMTASYEYWPSFVGDLRKLRKIWVCLYIILGREGVDPRVSGMFFKVVIQVTLIFGSEMWVMTPCMVWSLGGFQYRVYQRITGRQPWGLLDGIW